ncbi:beta-barrel fold lipoprotein [Chondrinema litorale]|uniref:beta-barrel fold lipoprotein n=1 Tax=Chondrinema litorale TaxID=2994555 RepID=UPI0025433D96|nr:hypothetical protein [Chondrinema litorale]UZR99607.1 hypothetical protein OQ292_37090 [Chondrinema litorale]
MKQSALYFLAFFFLAISCTDIDEDDITPEDSDTAIFKVQIEQEGNYDKFLRSLVFDTDQAVDDDFKNSETNEILEGTLYSESGELEDSNFTIVTRQKVKSISIQALISWTLGVEDGETASINLSIFINDEIIDTQTITLDGTGSANFQQTYNAADY